MTTDRGDITEIYARERLKSAVNDLQEIYSAWVKDGIDPLYIENNLHQKEAFLSGKWNFLYITDTVEDVEYSVEKITLYTD
jgi:hypothetical protein